MGDNTRDTADRLLSELVNLTSGMIEDGDPIKDEWDELFERIDNYYAEEDKT